MRIGVNLLYLSKDRFGGVEQYLKHIIWYLRKMDKNVKLFLFLTKPSRDLFPDFQERIQKVMIKEYNIHSDIHRLIEKYEIDLWFSPMHKSYVTDIQVPSVATIHDVLHTSYPQFVPGHFEENNRYYKKFTTSFDAILTVSEFSKSAISNYLQIPREKIHAIYQDAPAAFNRNISIHQGETDYSLEKGYALFPASFNPHKNHLNLLRALVLLREKFNTRIPLVLTGFTHKENEVYQSVLSFIKEHTLENQVNILGYVPSNHMPYLYANASFLAFPSLYEGFGIPLVEAMKAKCPIVCSNRGSIPEITGEAAIHFNPESPNDIALNILKLLNAETRNDLIRKGMARAQIFSWEKCASETLHVFRSVLRENEKR